MADFGPELLRLIKQTVGNYIQNQNLSDAVFATYTGKGLKVDDKPIEIEMDMVNVPEHLKKYKARISFDLTQEELDNRVLIVKKSGERVELSRLKFDRIPVTVEYDKMEAGTAVYGAAKAGLQPILHHRSGAGGGRSQRIKNIPSADRGATDQRDLSAGFGEQTAGAQDVRQR